jgi:chromosome segregation ATPase
MENVTRLEELLRRRDAEIEEAQSRIVDREQEAEHLRAQMNKMKREHSRSAEEHSRHFDEIAQREKAARTDMEDAVRRKAEDEVALGSIKGRVATLTDEVDRLRRQVHDLQQESADKEVKLLQLTKARAQDEEDKEGLNIALDSKQQELELVRVFLFIRLLSSSTLYLFSSNGNWA